MFSIMYANMDSSLRPVRLQQLPRLQKQHSALGKQKQNYAENLETTTITETKRKIHPHPDWPDKKLKILKQALLNLAMVNPNCHPSFSTFLSARGYCSYNRKSKTLFLYVVFTGSLWQDVGCRQERNAVKDHSKTWQILPDRSLRKNY